jgi:hypothetical protein
MFMGACMSAAARAQRPSSAAATDWNSVEQALGRRGLNQPGNVMRFGFPRGDLDVTIGDLHVLPALALGSWVAFLPEGSSATMMGDLVLTPEELPSVVDKLLAGGISVSAVHNHLLGESPRIVYAHIHGDGAVQQLAMTVHSALATTNTPLGPPPAIMPIRIDLDTASIARIIGSSGRVNGGTYQSSIPRAEPVSEAGHVLPPAMGVATAINFQPVGGGRAAVTGDFVMIASEVAAVERALRANHIAITALHSHMIDESPRLLFMHFWAVGDAAALARGLRAALDAMAVKRGA